MLTLVRTCFVSMCSDSLLLETGSREKKTNHNYAIKLFNLVQTFKKSFRCLMICFVFEAWDALLYFFTSQIASVYCPKNLLLLFVDFCIKHPPPPHIHTHTKKNLFLFLECFKRVSILSLMQIFFYKV